MEWVETTARSVDEAKDLALDRLGVGADEAEFDVVEEPRSGLFGRVRGEARVRARVKPASVRPKQDRRQRGRSQRNGKQAGRGSKPASSSTNGSGHQGDVQGEPSTEPSTESTQTSTEPSRSGSGNQQAPAKRSKQSRQNKEQHTMEQDTNETSVSPQEVGDAAVAFMSDLAAAFGVEGATADLAVDGTDLEVTVSGGELGLMVGPGGRTLTAIQDLARVAAQRRLGDHDTRLRIDVGGYREKRRVALEKFAATVAKQVIETGESKALEPMSSSDRKVVHDAIIEIDGVTSRSEGDDPRRRVVITPA